MTQKIRLNFTWEKCIIFKKHSLMKLQPKTFTVKLIKRRNTELGLIHELISSQDIELCPCKTPQRSVLKLPTKLKDSPELQLKFSIAYEPHT